MNTSIKKFTTDKIGIIGCGNLGKHLLKLIQSNSIQNNICASTKSKQSAKNLNLSANIYTTNDNSEVSKNSNIIFLTAKPFQIKEICEEIKETIDDKTIIVSTAAGIKFSNLQTWLNPKQPIIRCMPNIPISIGSGIIGFASNPCVSSYQSLKILELMRGPSHIWFNDENKIDSTTALSGCGPAFMAKILQYYVEAGINMGLNIKESKELVFKTMIGTINIMEEKNYCDITRNVNEIVEQVASKGGATEKGLIEFDKSSQTTGADIIDLLNKFHKNTISHKIY